MLPASILSNGKMPLSGYYRQDKRYWQSHRLSNTQRRIGEFKGIEEREQGVIAFAIEGKNGYGAPFDRIVIENGFKLYNVDNLKLRRFRDVFGSEWRNDRRDAKMLAKMLRLKDHMDAQEEKAFIAVEKPSAVHEKLRILSRHQQSLIDEKVRIQSRLRKRLLEVCPDILEHGDTNSKKLLQLLRKYPDFSRYKKITLGALLKIETIGKKTAVSILEGLRNIQYVEELTGIYKALISS